MSDLSMLRGLRHILLHHGLQCTRVIRMGMLVALALMALTCSGGPAAADLEAAPVPTLTSPSSVQMPRSVQIGDPPPAQPSQTTPIRFDRHSVEQGLSESVVLCMLQDSRGFLWIGTEDGLNRFDGYSFTVYRHDPEDSHSLSNSHITSIAEDPARFLWIGTYGGGLNRFDSKTGQFAHYRNDPQDANSLSYDQVLAVYADREGALWIGTRGGGLNRFDPGTGQWMQYRYERGNPTSLGNDFVTTILEDSSGGLWAGTTSGLNRLDRQTDLWHQYRWDPNDPYSLHGASIESIYEDRSGNLWIGTAGGGLNRFERGTETFVYYQHKPNDPDSLSSDHVTAVLEDSVGRLWVGTTAGLDRFDQEAERFGHYRNTPSDPHSLSADQVTTLLHDQSGGLWIGTRGGGLSRYDRQREQFTLYRADPDEPNSLSASGVWGIYEDGSGVLWIGTDGGGLDRFDRSTGEWRHYRHDPADPNSLSHDVVVAVYQDQSGVLWLSTWGGGLERFDPRTERFDHYRHDPGDPHSLSSNVVWFVHEDRSGALWVGTAWGLNRFERETEQFTRYYNDPADPLSLSDNNVGSVHEDRAGALWFGTHGGLNRFDRETEQFTRFQNDPNNPQSLSHNIVFVIHEDRAGALWLGTWGGGLNRFDQASGAFTHYRVKDGLPNDVVYGILEDDEGHLWMSTNNGLSEFDPQTETFKNYDVEDGLQSAEFDFSSYFRSPSGEMFFGGIKGVNAFYPNRISDNSYVPPIVLTSLSQGGERVVLDQTVETISDVTFRWPNNDFEFEFAALSFYQPEYNQYAYMLEGYDSGWNYVGTRRFGAYTNLPGGTYVLRLKGSNNDGLWNEEGLTLRVTLVPPFWATWWFRGAVVLLVVAGFIAGFRMRLRGIQVRGRELESQVASRTRELAALNAVAAVVSRSLDLQQILCDALDKTLEVMGLEAGGIYLLHANATGRKTDALTVAAHKGLSPEVVTGIDNLLVGEGFSGHVVQTGEPMVVHDLASDPRLTRSVIAESGFRSVAIVPVVSRAKVLGTLFVTTHESREFPPQEVQLLASIGGQIGVAIENGRFFEAEQRRAEQFRVIAEVGRRIALILDIDEVFEQVVTLVQEAFDYYHVSIGLVEDDEVVYRIGAGRLWGGRPFEGAPARLRVGKEGISGWVAATGKPLLVPDVRQDPHYVWMQPSETRSELAVPIVVKSKVVGVLDVQSDRLNAFDDTDVAVLQSLAHQIGAAIENARLYDQAQRTAVVEERSRLARELHDAVTQTLFSASLIAEALPASWEVDVEEGQELLKELQQLTRGAMAEMRTLLLELRPTALVDTSLADLLRQLAEATAGRMGAPVTIAADKVYTLPPDVHVTLYRIAQEALNNVVKHARATQVEVTLRCTPRLPGPDTGVRGEAEELLSEEEREQWVELCVCDNGRGFDQGVVPPDRLGLGIMHERAQAIGAQLTIESERGVGTRVRVVWVEDEGRMEKDE